MSIFLSSDLVISLSTDQYALDYPRALFVDDFAGGIITASTVATGFYAENVTDQYTFDYWRPTGVPAWIASVLPVARDINCACIAAHDIASAGASFIFQAWDGVTWVNCHDVITPVNDDTIMVFFTSVFCQQFRLYVFGGVPTIGVISAGTAFVFPSKMYGGHPPITVSRNTEIMHNISEGGFDLGRSIMRNGASTSVDIKHLTETWIRSQFEPLFASIRLNPFFFAWRPSSYPTEVAYCWVDSDLSPVATGPGNLVSIKFDIDGIINTADAGTP